jgi:hypothetical protein
MSSEQNQANTGSRGETGQQQSASGVQSHQNAGPEQEQAQQSGDHLGNVNEHEDKPGPAGGYDSTPISHAPPGYDVRITFKRATALPIADLHTMNSDPYIAAEIKSDLPSRHKEDPTLKFRSHTVFNSTEPVWDAVWQLAHVPASGFRLKARIYDEDANDRDDRLGNAHIQVGPISENWKDIKDQGYKIKKRSGSKRAYMLRAVAVAMHQKKEMSGELFVTIEVLGRSKGEEGGRMYTTGPNYWYKHFSLLLGRIANSRAPDEDTDSDESSEETQNGRAPDGEIAGNKRLSVEHPDKRRGSAMSKSSKRSSKGSGGKEKPGKYSFQANQFQLHGPVPAELYHRYVDFKPIISNLFTSKGIRGFILHKALHHQHGMVYNFSTTTKHGVFDHPSYDMTRQFLDMVHHDEGGRIHTYVITLDGLMRFTETGKEFGIDFLSKHTMHSDASIYIAYSGEFFIRRLQNPHQTPPEQAQAAASHGASLSNPNDQSNSQNGTGNHHGSLPSHSHAASTTGNDTHPPSPLDGGPPNAPPPHDPGYYELIIDNDSGTYRPNAKLLPVLASFLHTNFPGLKITTLDCNADADLMGKLKDEQRERKKAEGGNVVMTQMPRGKHLKGGKNPEDEQGGSSGSSLSSSDEERLGNELDGDGDDGHEPHALAAAAAPFAGNVVVKEGLKGQLGWQKKLRGLAHRE